MVGPPGDVAQTSSKAQKRPAGKQSSSSKQRTKMERLNKIDLQNEFSISKRHVDRVKLELKETDASLVTEKKVLVLHPTCVTNNADILLRLTTGGNFVAFVPVHKAVVQESLAYFEAMFRGNSRWKEAIESSGDSYTTLDIEIPQLQEPRLIRSFFGMLYQDHCYLDTTEQRDMYRLADFFDHSELRKSLSAKIKDTLTLQNLLEIYNLGVDFHEVCQKFTQENKVNDGDKSTSLASGSRRKRKRKTKKGVKEWRSKVIRTLLDTGSSNSSSSSSGSSSDSDAGLQLPPIPNIEPAGVVNVSSSDSSDGLDNDNFMNIFHHGGLNADGINVVSSSDSSELSSPTDSESD